MVHDFNKLKQAGPEIYIFTGHYGSGKTELAINLAELLKTLHPDREVAIADMDIVNPFFRTADAAETLRKEGIRVEVPLYAQSNVDVPALTPQMGYLIENPDVDLVLDIGGDDVGAKAVGRYSEEIVKRGYNLLFVVNKHRPFTRTPEGALKIFRETEASAAIRITGLVNNTHLLEYTDGNTLKEGIPLLRELSEITGVPTVFHSAFREIITELQNSGDAAQAETDGPVQLDGLPIIPMREHISLLWDRHDHSI